MGIYVSYFGIFGSVFWYFSKQLRKLAWHVSMQYSKFGNVIGSIQNNLENRVLKSDLKSTIITPTESARYNLLLFLINKI